MSVSLCSLISVVGCMWLLYKLCRFDRNRRSRPFPRQLLSLTIADILFHSAQFVVCQVDYGPTNIAASFHLGCTAFMTAEATFRSVSVLSELNLALTFMCQALRFKAVHTLIQYGVPFSWFFGVLVVLPWQVFSIGWHWDEIAKFCMFSATDWIGMILIVSSGLLCLISYVVVVGRSLYGDTLGHVFKDYFRMAAIYPLNFLITYGCVVFIYIGSGLFKNSQFFAISATLEALGGFLNVITYALLSRRLRLNLAGSACLRSAHRPSFRVSIGPEEVIDYITLESSLLWTNQSSEEESADGLGEGSVDPEEQCSQ